MKIKLLLCIIILSMFMIPVVSAEKFYGDSFWNSTFEENLTRNWKLLSFNRK